MLTGYNTETGENTGFQVRGGGAHLKKLRRAEGGAKIFGVFRVKNQFFQKKFGGEGEPGAPPPGSAPVKA